ncbi:MAG: CarD family transcriptional regulator [Clostridia bacterium]|nr:CarD family transcriptional regulator [Clostridia bacterium]
MLKLGQTVSYGSQGVCTITEIVEKEIGGKRSSYYVLKPIYRENNTIFVPVDNEKLTGKMRSLLSKEEIEELILSIPEEKTLWIDEDGKRREAYREILSSGNLRGVIGVTKTLYGERKRRREAGKKLGQQDEMLLERAESLLCDEFAQGLGIKPSEVISFISAKLDGEK